MCLDRLDDFVEVDKGLNPFVEVGAVFKHGDLLYDFINLSRGLRVKRLFGL